MVEVGCILLLGVGQVPLNKSIEILYLYHIVWRNDDLVGTTFSAVDAGCCILHSKTSTNVLNKAKWECS